MQYLILRKACDCRKCGKAIYLWIQVVNPRDCLLDVTTIKGLANVPSALYACKVNSGLDARLKAEFLCSRFISLNNEIIHDEAIEVTSDKRMSALSIHGP